MRLRKEQSGFVLSGVALLLVLPAMLLVASFLNVVTVGGETTSLQVVADKVFYTGHDTERMIKHMENRGLPLNNETLGQLAENYQASTGLLVDLPGVVVYPIWTLRTSPSDNTRHYAGTKYCRITTVSSKMWWYSFEDKDEEKGESPDWDYNEPRLQVEKLDGSIKVTFLEYDGGYTAKVYYGDNIIFSEVKRGSSSDPDNTVIVENVLQLNVPVLLRDPRGAAQYSATVPLTYT